MCRAEERVGAAGAGKMGDDAGGKGGKAGRAGKTGGAKSAKRRSQPLPPAQVVYAHCRTKPARSRLARRSARLRPTLSDPNIFHLAETGFWDLRAGPAPAPVPVPAPPSILQPKATSKTGGDRRQPSKLRKAEHHKSARAMKSSQMTEVDGVPILFAPPAGQLTAAGVSSGLPQAQPVFPFPDKSARGRRPDQELDSFLQSLGAGAGPVPSPSSQAADSAASAASATVTAVAQAFQGLPFEAGRDRPPPFGLQMPQPPPLPQPLSFAKPEASNAQSSQPIPVRNHPSGVSLFCPAPAVSPISTQRRLRSGGEDCGWVDQGASAVPSLV